MSHNGIYIGGGKFVHAENEGDGVKVSELADEYYASRWYGAVRFNVRDTKILTIWPPGRKPGA